MTTLPINNLRACEKCGGTFAPMDIDFQGMIISRDVWCEPCDIEEAMEIEAKKEADGKENAARIFYRGIPVRFHNAVLGDLNPSKTVTDWLDNPEGFMFISGACGVGKTHLACATVLNFRRKNKRCEIVYSSDLFLSLRGSFGDRSRESEQEIINNMTEPHVIVFDDIGAQKLSDYVIEAWYTIIDRRYRDNLPTMFTSNLGLREISAYMTDRVASRLASGIVYELNGDDKRLRKVA